jgi:hypothetical protein
VALDNKTWRSGLASLHLPFQFLSFKNVGKTLTSAIVSSVDSKLLEGASVLLLKKRRGKVCLKKGIFLLSL